MTETHRAASALAQNSLALWPLPDSARVQLINISENHTYRVDVEDQPVAILRLHRPGYQDRAAIQSEIAWMAALARDGTLSPPQPRAGHDGQFVQQIAREPERFAVLFDALPGDHPKEDGPLATHFETLGWMAARLHHHAKTWTRPPGFTRRRWDIDAVFGANAIWGDWRAAPGVTPDITGILAQAEAQLRHRLAEFGQGADRFGLIHADMRLANLLVDGRKTQLIDFDDCGFGWFLYDFAAAVSFIETRSDLPELKSAWLRGYGPLPAEDVAEIGSFIMLRRMALLAWIGSHIEAPEPQALAPTFAADTARLASRYLNGTL
ncbi:MAG: phosphotransferase [Pseudomonadota bacterium]